MYVTVRQDRQTSTITYAPSVHTTHIFGSFSIEDNNDQVKKVFLLESSNECRSRRTPRNGGNWKYILKADYVSRCVTAACIGRGKRFRESEAWGQDASGNRNREQHGIVYEDDTRSVAGIWGEMRQKIRNRGTSTPSKFKDREGGRSTRHPTELRWTTSVVALRN